MANKCQVQTPKKYVIEMLDYVGYREHLYGKRVLENSCGEGNLLCEIVKRYIRDARNHNYSNEDIVNGLGQDICAYEIDHDCIRKCKKRINRVAYGFGLKGIKWNIRKEDFLTSKEGKFDFIIGNPPYITYHDLTEEQRNFLKDNFVSCKEGRFDYSYAFIEASLKRLADNGQMIYLVPYSITTNKFAEKLRELLMPYLKAIYDYKTIKIFPDWNATLRAKKIRIELMNDEQKEIILRCFPFEIETIINNLVANSVASFDKKKTEEREITIKVYEENGYVVIDYADTGQGLSAAFKKEPRRTLNPFESDKRDASGNLVGTGMGLWIVNNTVNDYGGSIDLDKNKITETGYFITLSLKK